MLDFTPPWPRVKYADLLREYAGVNLADAEAVRRKAAQLGMDVAGKDDAVIANQVFEATVEHRLIQPTFVYDYPAAICPLTRRHPEDPSIALRFEAFVAGMEIGNAYTELNDPRVQRENSRGRWPARATRRWPSWTRISCWRWNTVCRRRADWAWASTVWSCC